MLTCGRCTIVVHTAAKAPPACVCHQPIRSNTLVIQMCKIQYHVARGTYAQEDHVSCMSSTYGWLALKGAECQHSEVLGVACSGLIKKVIN